MNKLREVIAHVLEIDTASINGSTSQDNVPTWDSFKGLMLIAEIERNFQMKFTMEDIVGITCVQDIQDTLQKYGIEV